MNMSRQEGVRLSLLHAVDRLVKTFPPSSCRFVIFVFCHFLLF